jgi:hypothetical protein
MAYVQTTGIVTGKERKKKKTNLYPNFAAETPLTGFCSSSHLYQLALCPAVLRTYSCRKKKNSQSLQIEVLVATEMIPIESNTNYRGITVIAFLSLEKP